MYSPKATYVASSARRNPTARMKYLQHCLLEFQFSFSTRELKCLHEQPTRVDCVDEAAAQG